MKNERIIYTAIVRKKHTILAEFTDCSGNFSQIAIGIIDEVLNSIEIEPYQYKAKFIYGKYAFYIVKDHNIYIILMVRAKNIKSNIDFLFYNFLFNIRADVSKKIDIDDPFKLRPYSLGNYLPELKTKVFEFNKSEIKFNDNLDKPTDINKFELIDNKIFNENKLFPILSNAQVHAEKNLLSKEKDNNSTYNNETWETLDSFEDDILKGTYSSEEKMKEEDLSISIKDFEQTEFDKNFRVRKKKKLWPKILIPTVFLLIVIILLLLDMFIFKIFIKI